MTTDFKWVAALLASEHIAPRRNTRSFEHFSFEGGLALQFVGRGSEAAEYLDSSDFIERAERDPSGANLIRSAIAATTAGSTEEGMAGLAELVATADSPVVVTVAALVAAVSAAHLDQVDLGLGVLSPDPPRVISGC